MTQKNDTVVRASINERALFSSLKHMFASGFAIIGEMLQNARRAGATQIKITSDELNNTLTVQDDGCGIDDFSKLITLCESGWSDEVMIRDNPFGMGVFSLFFACESVQFSSKGYRLVVGLDDIVQRRELRIEPWPTPTIGTTIILNHLSQDVRYTQAIREAVKFFAHGFSVPVLFNDIAVDQSHAVNCPGLEFEPFAGGKVALKGWKLGDSFGVGHSRWGSFQVNRSRAALFLQGLPIEETSIRADFQKQLIIHLDGTVFTPKMPDRATLYDSQNQLKVIDGMYKDWVRQKLTQIKTQLSPEEFVRQYWDDCVAFGGTHLLNDIEFVPAKLFYKVHELHCDSDCMYQNHYINDRGQLYGASEFKSGAIKAWRNTPTDYSDKNAGTILRLMERDDIHGAGDIPQGHWLLGLTADAGEFHVEVTPSGEKGRAEIGWNENMTAVLVDSIQIKITSAVDEDFLMARTLDDAWVLVDESKVEHQQQLICYFTSKDDSPDHPLTFVESFTDNNDTFRGEWRDEAISAANQVLSMLRGAGFGRLMIHKINELQIPLTDAHLGSFVLSGVYRKYDEIGEKYTPRHQTVELGDAVWDSVGQMLGSSAQQVKEAFIKASGFELVRGGSEDPAWVAAKQLEEQMRENATA